MCLFMMGFLPLDTWLRLAVWTAIGLVIYYVYFVEARQAEQICGEKPGAGIDARERPSDAAQIPIRLSPKRSSFTARWGRSI